MYKSLERKVRLQFFIISVIVTLSTGCNKEFIKPESITSQVTEVTSVKAIISSTVSGAEDFRVDIRGVVWDTAVNPTMDKWYDNTRYGYGLVYNNLGFTENGSGKGAFTSIVQYLLPETKYYCRTYVTSVLNVYAVPESVTFYGDQISFVTSSTPSTAPVTDIDNNAYPTILIGSEIWMAKNLRVRRYQNGDSIPLVASSEEWSTILTGACSGGYTTEYDTLYGYFYNWFAVTDSRNICPAGWHVPSADDFGNLVSYIGGGSDKLLKEGISIGPTLDPVVSSNSSGFTGLLGGWRSQYGYISPPGEDGRWWSATESIYENARAGSMYLNTYSTNIEITGILKNAGLSVRCIKDSK